LFITIFFLINQQNMSTFDHYSKQSIFGSSFSKGTSSLCEQIVNRQQNHDLLFVCCFDEGSRELGINHLESLKRQGIENYLAFIADRSTYNIVKSKGYNCQRIDYQRPEISSEKKTFGTPNFTEFSFVRYKYIHEKLKQYKAVWYMDVDTVVLENLNKTFLEYSGKGYDIVFQDDIHQIQNCTGCQLYFSSQKALDMTIHIYNGMNNSLPDQHYVNFFLQRNPGIFKTTMFDRNEFPNGLLYFENRFLIQLNEEFSEHKKTYEKSCKQVLDKHTKFVHANWMVGIQTKIDALKDKGLWYI
jgi:hypothetical protein